MGRARQAPGLMDRLPGCGCQSQSPGAEACRQQVWPNALYQRAAALPAPSEGKEVPLTRELSRPNSPTLLPRHYPESLMSLFVPHLLQLFRGLGLGVDIGESHPRYMPKGRSPDASPAGWKWALNPLHETCLPDEHPSVRAQCCC